MCGIVGIIHLDGTPFSRDQHGPVLQAMGDLLSHRGPDAQTVYVEGSVGFLFRRLSIIDLQDGQQPFISEDGAIVHMTNGEIYNHQELRQTRCADFRFRTRSDCEVLTPLYEQLGRDYLTPINGMFATALLDNRRRKLLLSRDRLGIKPLYYYQSRDRLVFASEIKALLVHPSVPREFNWQQALTYSNGAAQLVAHSRLPSFFRDIHYLPGGWQLEVDLQSGQTQSRPYWDPQAAAAGRPRRSADEYVEEYRALLEDAVRSHLQADVEYGLFLSGGIDSVAVARLAARHAPAFHTFTVLGQSTLTNGDAESAHRAAGVCGLPNHQVLFDWRELQVTPRDWKQILWACELHLSGAEQLYKYALHAHAKAVRPALKVMLLGQGSDEYNGGYSRTYAEQELGGRQAGSWETLEQTLAGLLRLALTKQAGSYSDYQTLVPTAAAQALGRHSLLHRGVIPLSYLSRWADVPLPAAPFDIYRQLYREPMQLYQLWHEDRTAAAHSIENRVPFLDHRLVELLYSIPPELHRELFWDKQILRRAMRAELPPELCQREKVPFFYGDDVRYTQRILHRMLVAEGGTLVEEALAAASAAGGVLDGDQLRRIVAELPQDPDYKGAQLVLELVNMGLLSSMASQLRVDSAAALRVTPAPIAVREVADLAQWLQARAQSPTVAIDHDLSRIPAFADGILFVRCEGGDPSWSDPGSYYILRDQTLLFVIEASTGDWIRFLKQIDGRRSSAAILRQLDLAAGQIWKFLEEALEQRVLVWRDA